MKVSFTSTLIFVEIKLILYESFYTRTRFEAEVKRDSKMAY